MLTIKKSVEEQTSILLAVINIPSVARAKDSSVTLRLSTNVFSKQGWTSSALTIGLFQDQKQRFLRLLDLLEGWPVLPDSKLLCLWCSLALWQQVSLGMFDKVR